MAFKTTGGNQPNKFWDNTNSGILFINEEKLDQLEKRHNNEEWDERAEKWADRKGSINVEGKEYWVSAWTKESREGKEFISLALKPKEARRDQERTAPAQTTRSTGFAKPNLPPQHTAPNDDDSIPF